MTIIVTNDNFETVSEIDGDHRPKVKVISHDSDGTLVVKIAGHAYDPGDLLSTGPSYQPAEFVVYQLQGRHAYVNGLSETAFDAKMIARFPVRS